jgi:hypothetical protein
MRMTRTKPKSERAARRSAEASGVSLPLDASVAAIVASFEGHDLTGALTGLRKRGFAAAIDRSDKDRGSIYRIERGPAGEDNAAGHADTEQANSETPPKKADRQGFLSVRNSATFPYPTHAVPGHRV